MNRKYIVPILIFPALLLLSGCFDTSFTIQVRYAEVIGLKQGNPVYFKESEIGKVQKVSYSQQGDYLVELSIVPEFKNAATADSRFVIDDDLKNHQGKAVIILQERPGGRVLANGEIVQGSIKAGFLNDMVSGIKRTATAAQFGMQEAVQEMKKSFNLTSQKLDQEMAGALDDLSRQLHDLHLEVKKVPDKQEIKQLEQTLNRFAEEVSKTQQNVREHLRKELIPQLHKELDRLQELLHEQGRDEEVEGIDKQVKEMSRI